MHYLNILCTSLSVREAAILITFKLAMIETIAINDEMSIYLLVTRRPYATIQSFIID